jgi:hypothetical protein
MRAINHVQPGTRATSQQQAELTTDPFVRRSGLAPVQTVSFSNNYSAPSEVVILMTAANAISSQPIHITKWRPRDWVDHFSFGVGQVSECRGDKLDIDFVNGGRKTLLKSTELNRAVAPGADGKLPRDKSKARIRQLKVKRLQTVTE